MKLLQMNMTSSSAITRINSLIAAQKKVQTFVWVFHNNSNFLHLEMKKHPWGWTFHNIEECIEECSYRYCCKLSWSYVVLNIRTLPNTLVDVLILNIIFVLNFCITFLRWDLHRSGLYLKALTIKPVPRETGRHYSQNRRITPSPPL